MEDFHSERLDWELSEVRVQRNNANERVRELEAENAELRQQKDALVEAWVRIDDRLPEPNKTREIELRSYDNQRWFARYWGEGQFSLHTSSELQEDGTLKKFYANTIYKTYFTHWKYAIPFLEDAE